MWQAPTAILDRRKLARSWLVAELILVCTITPCLGFELGKPVACELGRECQILQVVDRDSSPGAVDFQCGSLTYDAHTGIDFALPSWKRMADGVDVVAAANGRVRGVRDGMEDRLGHRRPNGDIEGRECGNGVVLEHEDGWSTQYCHMRRGSVLPRQGDRVEAGQKLGVIGASGNADFPHLHFVVRNGQQLIDPFDGQRASDQCSASRAGTALWAPSSGIALQPGGILAQGFLDRVPEYSEVWNSEITSGVLALNGPGLVAWAHFYGLREGDVIDIRVKTPSGEEFARDRYEMPRNRATQFRAVGRRLASGKWPPGEYRSEASLVRNGEVLETRTGTVRLR